MYDYNSNHPAPWLEYSDKVVSIEISDGITQLGTQVFKNLSNVKDVKLPQSLIHIRANAFIGCSGLRNVYMYSGVTSIDEYAFHGAWLNKCTYYGTEDEWNAIIIGDHNDPLMTCEKEFI